MAINTGDTFGFALRLFQNRDKIMELMRDFTSLWNVLKPPIDIGTTTPDAPAPKFDVKWVQDSLNKVLGTDLVVDGDMGPKTHDVIKQFQAAHGLEADGWMGPLTAAALDAAIKGLG
jgi:peptidoglycan hydrolase-like protein with peptidoglycan-binding domain